MSENKRGIGDYIGRVIEETAPERKAVANAPRKPLPGFPVSRETVVKKGIPLSFAGLFAATQVLKDPLGILRFLSPRKAGAASEGNLNNLETQTNGEGIIGIGFTINERPTNLRAEPAIDVSENNEEREIEVVEELPQYTQVVIRRSVPSINPQDKHVWYEVEAITNDTETLPTGYIRADVLVTSLEENLNYNTEIYNTHRIILATDEDVNDREQEALIEGIELFADYLKNINVESYPATVFALTDFDQIIRMVVGYYRRDGLRTPEEYVRREYQDVNAMAQSGKTVFFNLARHGGTSTNDIRRIVIHELTHTLQEFFTGRALNVRGGTTETNQERPYGPIIIREGFSEMVGLELTQRNWRSILAGTLSITASPNDLITPDQFLAYKESGGFSYGAFFCYFLENRYPGKIIEFHRNMGTAFQENRNFEWREVFTEAFGDTFENISQRFMDEKNSLIPEELEVAVDTIVESPYPIGASVVISHADATSYRVVDLQGRTASLFGGSRATYQGMANLEGLSGEYLILEDDYGRTVYMNNEIAQSSGFAELLLSQQVASVPQN